MMPVALGVVRHAGQPETPFSANTTAHPVVFCFMIYNVFMARNKQTVHGEVVPPNEDAQKLRATRLSDAEILAVTRHQRINMIWEYTQAYMAILVISTVLITCCWIAITTKDDGKRTAALLFMTGLANLIAGFYFGRTNHTRPTGESE